MLKFDKIREASIAEEKDRASRASEIFRIFLAGPFINVNEASDHEDNDKSDAHRLRFAVYHELSHQGYQIYLGEDVELRTIGAKHYKRMNNAVVFERHYILNHADAVIIIPSSPGSFCEVGDWITSEELCQKIAIIVDSQFEGKNSYFNDGVVAHARLQKAAVHYISYAETEKVIDICNEFLEDIAARSRVRRLYGK